MGTLVLEINEKDLRKRRHIQKQSFDSILLVKKQMTLVIEQDIFILIRRQKRKNRPIHEFCQRTKQSKRHASQLKLFFFVQGQLLERTGVRRGQRLL